MRRPHRELERPVWLSRCAAGQRSTPTWSEQMLFQCLKGSAVGVRFVRQAVVGRRWVVDLYAPSARLVVEIDGGVHRDRVRKDARRDRELRQFGYRVLRLPAELVEKDVVQAVALVREALRAPP